MRKIFIKSLIILMILVFPLSQHSTSSKLKNQQIIHSRSTFHSNWKVILDKSGNENQVLSLQNIYPPLWCSVTDLGTLGGDHSEARGINDLSHVVGGSRIAPSSFTMHTFLWTETGGMVDLGEGEFARAYDINELGQIVGDLNQNAFLWTKEDGYINLGSLGSGSANASAINENGMVVGSSVVSGNFHAFYWTQQEGMQDIGSLGGVGATASDVNNQGQIVGSSYINANERHAYVWTEQDGFRDLGFTGFNYTAAAGINNMGQIVGCSMNTSDFYGTNHAVLWTEEGVPIDLGRFEDNPTEAWHINDDQQIVGGFWTSPNGSKHFFLCENGYMREIKVGQEWELEHIADINNNLLMVGWGKVDINNDGIFDETHALLLIPFPDTFIDIQPGNSINHINPKSNGVIQVAIFTTQDFDVRDVDTSTILFGRTGYEASPKRISLKDVEKDGDMDMILQFKIRDTGIQCGDTVAYITGMTLGNQSFRGFDSIKTVGCK
ncbi:hypothetical protein ACFLT2_03350 [Acidobacteriota bacterium]